MKNWIELLKEARSIGVEKVPKGFKTRAEIEIELGVGQAQALRRIREWKNRGFLECRSFKIDINGVIRPVPHYRIV